SLLAAWARPLVQAGRLLPDARVAGIGPDSVQPGRWQLQTRSQDGAQQVHAGFDAVLLLVPAAQARALLVASGIVPALANRLQAVEAAPCWTLMVAYPHAVQPGLTTLGPQWNAARSTHHRIAWVARESSKPGRAPVERWTAHASPAWSSEHRDDAPARVQAKLLKAFAEVTGLRATPVHAEVLCWPDAQTTRPLGQSHLWDARAGIGLAGDWCLGHRIEDAFVSGLELALAVA
ncbi:NAD(P)/FAD-dependent oxidoreductase, partial [Paracidovorax cattleyae]|nr:amine oxidase [Paracidovorax cattleyae]